MDDDDLIDVGELKTRVRTDLADKPQRWRDLDLTRAVFWSGMVIILGGCVLVWWADRGMPGGPGAAWYDRVISGYCSLFWRPGR